ncbi:hypothetical protein Xcel_2181 [Xylanimonas cellulosilytica DSM 15894]|uniref:Transmembrane protein n=1 Tax=Xylanimonas cellulosilytica (strain DSM 15894 / JCM 12276 / CECT 5975 / KCTC 9989 / LMG 20990 / NBRC 107835 / XIL07) TaxID=446471 RepID=D1BUW0_XYLCX|nr:hypothetical protein [Xylanimonas cellulosilytica]ACZ31199.1 hypothetical protein Xcel_2181 [Xylanimonas cellulosilytica DSM 15894]
MSVNRWFADPARKRWITRVFWLVLAALWVGGLFVDDGAWWDAPVAVVALLMTASEWSPTALKEDARAQVARTRALVHATTFVASVLLVVVIERGVGGQGRVATGLVAVACWVLLVVGGWLGVAHVARRIPAAEA